MDCHSSGAPTRATRPTPSGDQATHPSPRRRHGPRLTGAISWSTFVVHAVSGTSGESVTGVYERRHNGRPDSGRQGGGVPLPGGAPETQGRVPDVTESGVTAGVGGRVGTRRSATGTREAIGTTRTGGQGTSITGGRGRCPIVSRDRYPVSGGLSRSDSGTCLYLDCRTTRRAFVTTRQHRHVPVPVVDRPVPGGRSPSTNHLPRVRSTQDSSVGFGPTRPPVLPVGHPPTSPQRHACKFRRT